jgi:nucleoside phosphorylase
MPSPGVCDVLLLAAFLPELAHLRSVLGGPMRGRVGRLEVAARIVGIGLPSAAVGAMAHIVELQPRSVVAIGSCGAYRGELAIGDVIVSSRIRLADASVVAGLAQFPEPMSLTIESDGHMVEGLARAGAHLVDVATTLAITVSDASSSAIARVVGAQVEHLEAFAVGAACAARGVPFAAVLGVANSVGARAREEWRANHGKAEEAATQVLLRWLNREEA